VVLLGGMTRLQGGTGLATYNARAKWRAIAASVVRTAAQYCKPAGGARVARRALFVWRPMGRGRRPRDDLGRDAVVIEVRDGRCTVSKA